LLTALFLSACDGSGVGVNSGMNVPAATNPDVSVDVSEPDAPNPGGGTDVGALISRNSRIDGEIKSPNDVATACEISIKISADIAGRLPPITFNLDNGGGMTNLLSPTRVSVAVPANAFESTDGTLAIGDAEVSITEIDIEDLNGEGAWAPNLFGIGEGMSEESVLATFGMSDFHFSQDGRDLQLRPGMTATIKTDMLTTVVIPKGETLAIEAAEGMLIPIGYYDTEDMIRKRW
jgi:hypothetical protein